MDMISPRKTSRVARRFKVIVATALIVVACAAPARSEPLTITAVALWVWGTTLGPYVIGSVIAHAAALGSYIAWTRPTAGATTHNVDSTKVTRDAEAIWVDLAPLTLAPTVYKAPDKATIDSSAMRDKILSSSAQKALYPNLAPKMEASNVMANNIGAVVGSIINAPGYGQRRVTDAYVDNANAYYGGASSKSPIYFNTNSWWFDNPHQSGGYTVLTSHYIGYTADASAPVYTPAAPATIQTALQTAVGNPAIQSSFKGEIDDFITANPNMMIPEEPLPMPATEAAIKYETARAASAALAASAQAESVKTGTVAAAARAAAAGARASATASPADLGLAQEATRLEGLADAAEARDAGAKTRVAGVGAVASSQEAQDSKDKEDVPVGVPASPARKVLDFAPLDGLKTALSTTYPFNLPSSIAGFYHQFSVAPVIPTFDLPMPLGNVMHVDLAPFDGVATLLRYLVGLSTTVGGLWYIIHFFRGIS